MNRELSALFEEIADLMEIQGQDRFRVNSYRKVARSLKDLAGDVVEMQKQGRLTEIDGVGKGQAERIDEYIRTGQMSIHQKLLAQVPEGLPALLSIPGMGPKKVALVWKELGVKNVEDLRAAIASGKMAALPGLGEQSVKKIADGLAFLEKSRGRTPLGMARPIAEALAEAVRSLRGVKQVEIAGSLRRGCETIGDVDLLCMAKDGAAVVEAFTQLGDVQQVLAKGETKGSVVVPLPGGAQLQVDLRVVPRESFGAALQYFTGSKEHNIRLRERAVKRKLKLNEWGLFEGEKALAGEREEDIYKELGVACVPPECREDRGEFEKDAGKRAAGLIAEEDILGDLHMHTRASDGRSTIEEMAEAAKARGYKYIAITDHSKSSAIANGLTIERMEQHIETIRAAAKKIKGIAVLVGTEVDIHADGTLDYPDEILAVCDVVVASVHAAQSQPREKVTARVIRAIENPYVTMLGHATGRLLGRREPMQLDMGAVIAAAVRTGTVLEINASWQRLDLKDVHARQALDAGATLCINTDAHHTDQLEQMRLGVITARRAWVPKERVLNALPLAQLRKRLQLKRK